MSEHLVLMGAYGRVQERCSRELAAQAAQIAALQTQVVRLNAALMLRDSAMAVVQEELGSASPRSTGWLSRLRGLLQVGRWPAKGPQGPGADRRGMHEKSVLCIAQGHQGPALAQHWVAMAGCRYVHQPADELEHADEVALEASLRAADLVICQTGCVSHGAWWRVEDHCRRTGKPCLVVAAAAQGGAEQPLHDARPRAPLSG